MTEHVVPRLSFRGRLWLIVAGSMAVIAPGVLGQGGAAPTATAPTVVATDVKVPVFDVVIVKPNHSGSGSTSMNTNNDSFSATNISLKRLLERAYDIKEDLISGEPGWVDSARFDLKAKVVDPNIDELKKLSPEQRRSMLQPVLTERFQLKVHTETRILPIYEMVVAKGGPRFKETQPGETADGDKGSGTIGRGGMSVRNTELTAREVPLSSLTDVLSRQLHRTVLDKTGLTGKYDLELKWAPESSDPMFKGTDGSQQRTEPAPDATGPSLFTALQEQLGLKLQSGKGPVETLVIDHVEMPTEN
jgi:uncharacterized protein (TIGR03435 family)